MANRSDNARITASVTATINGVPGTKLDLGTFEDRKGGHSDSGSTVVNRGGMGDRESLGGKPEPENLTITRVRDDGARSYEKTLRQGVGRLPITVTEVGLDDEKNEIAGDSTTWTGKLKKVGTTDRAEDSNAAEMLELEIVVEKVV